MKAILSDLVHDPGVSQSRCSTVFEMREEKQDMSGSSEFLDEAGSCGVWWRVVSA